MKRPAPHIPVDLVGTAPLQEGCFFTGRLERPVSRTILFQQDCRKDGTQRLSIASPQSALRSGPPNRCLRGYSLWRLRGWSRSGRAATMALLSSGATSDPGRHARNRPFLPKAVSTARAWRACRRASRTGHAGLACSALAGLLAARHCGSATCAPLNRNRDRRRSPASTADRARCCTAYANTAVGDPPEPARWRVCNPLLRPVPTRLAHRWGGACGCATVLRPRCVDHETS
jgi:hypothetical protein